MLTRLRAALPAEDSPVIDSIVRVFARQLNERAGVALEAAAGPCDVRLVIRPGIGAEGYAIEDGSSGEIVIAGNDQRGLFYGIGAFLRKSQYGEGTITPTAWRGTSVPERDFRKLYFASHFFNFYHAAPVEKIARYIEDIMLWGYNGLLVWFDMHHFNGIDDPAAQEMIARLRALLETEKALGLDIGLMVLANEGYLNSPEALRAEWECGKNGYTAQEISHYHVEICPHKPGGMEEILREMDGEFAAFADLGLDFISIWPYDQGGCTCPECAPWGANGFLLAAEQIARLFRTYSPNGKVSLSTWLFEHAYPGEWPAFAAAAQGRLSWADYVMVDTFADQPFPQYPLQHGLPDGKPMINFPEISMLKTWPWGGSGASPYPAHLQAIWDMSKDKLGGGYPYSEGIFEDINKAICAQFYWGDRPAMDTVREYLAYYFGAEVANSLLPVVEIYERTLAHWTDWKSESVLVNMSDTDGVGEALAAVKAAESRMTPHARRNWRWRIFALRAHIDAELAASGGKVTPACNVCLQELVEIYHAQQASMPVAPPTLENASRIGGRIFW